MKIDETFLKFIDSKCEMDNAVHNIREAISLYIQKFNLKALVIGISGGIDSTLCALLAYPVCQNLNIPLVGRSITIETNSNEEIERSLEVGERFCNDFKHLNLTKTYLQNRENLSDIDDSLLSKLRLGNLKARMRMMILYDLAQLNRGIVLATDNFTEYLTGFWTLHGDVGDFAPLISLWKTEIYRISSFLLDECNEKQAHILQQCIEAIPVDGLGISHSDCEQLGVKDYFEADRIFLDYFNGDKTLENHILIRKYLNSEYKRNNPIFLSRKEVLKHL